MSVRWISIVSGRKVIKFYHKYQEFATDNGMFMEILPLPDKNCHNNFNKTNIGRIFVWF